MGTFQAQFTALFTLSSQSLAVCSCRSDDLYCGIFIWVCYSFILLWSFLCPASSDSSGLTVCHPSSYSHGCFRSCVPKFGIEYKFLKVCGTDEPCRKVTKGLLFAKCIRFWRSSFPPYCECFLLLFLWVMYIYFLSLRLLKILSKKTIKR